MTRPGIEPRSPGPLANILLIKPMARGTRYITKYIETPYISMLIEKSYISVGKTLIKQLHKNMKIII